MCCVRKVFAFEKKQKSREKKEVSFKKLGKLQIVTKFKKYFEFYPLKFQILDFIVKIYGVWILYIYVLKFRF